MASKDTINRAAVRMYRMGTGDCFVLKFFSDDPKAEPFKMMIDCGAWSGSAEHLSKYVKDLMTYVDNSVDVLVVTHEHLDHVHGFNACKKLFTSGFKAKETWLSWAEDDRRKEVKSLKRKYGTQKRSIALAAKELNKALAKPAVRKLFLDQHRGQQALDGHLNFGQVLNAFVGLQYVESKELGVYAGPLPGMTVVKEQITPTGDNTSEPNLRFFEPGQIIEEIPGLEGIRIYVLGPPTNPDEILSEHSGEEGESYKHNKEYARGDAFAAAVNALAPDGADGVKTPLPFDRAYEVRSGPTSKAYNDKAASWRRIDHDWLMSAGSLALRVTTGLNNLSLVLAIEFVESGRVMLFPGDAEYGSWSSWHDIDWSDEGRGTHHDGTPKHLTEDLLNRTVFYKVAHHLSHNGTAQRKGLGMMRHKDLAAMATLDYDVISNGWTGTMPNEGILKELLEKTRGRLMIMNTNGLFLNARKTIKLAPKIAARRAEMTASEAAAFKKAHTEPKKTSLFIDFEVKG